MPSATDRPDPPRDLSRRLDRLAGLPLRPATARLALTRAGVGTVTGTGGADDAAWRRLASIDPGWALGELAAIGPVAPLARVASTDWWRAPAPAVDRLWRHSVAAACAARQMAVEAGDPEPDRWASLALLARLGWWALAREDAATLDRLLDLPDPGPRRLVERQLLGADLATIGRRIAERWGLDPALVEVVGHVDDLAAELLVGSRFRPIVERIQRAYRWVERTPWALIDADDDLDPSPSDPRRRMIVAEVQARCGEGLVDEPASDAEEDIARRHADLLIRVESMEAGIASRDRLLAAIADHRPADPPDAWADRASMAWCSEPGVATARVVWRGEPRGPREPARVVALGRPGSDDGADALIWDDGTVAPASAAPPDLVLRAWSAWAEQVGERRRLRDRLDGVGAAVRDRADAEAATRASGLLEQLAEFAAGAGHELNNPLAVIQGRAQLLLARADDPDQARSLRAIVAQAQRAHRILRDLMYVARPPAPKLRREAVGEFLRSAIREAQPEAESRGVTLKYELGDRAPEAWIDPEGLSQLIDALIRNALETSGPGAVVRVDASATADGLSLSVVDRGEGLTPEVARHLLDPFFSGRQAGRGLGMGLPRAARFLGRLGGGLTWQSHPGRGSRFRAFLPLVGPKAEGDGQATWSESAGVG